jgi:hypothetical protein
LASLTNVRNSGCLRKITIRLILTIIFNNYV